MRDERLAWLSATLNAVVASSGGRSGRAVALIGGPGAGKTWLATETLARLPCLHLTMPASTPLARLAPELARDANLPAWAKSALEGAIGGAAVDAAALAGALTAYLKQKAPFVLHLDDLHEALPEVARVVELLAAGVTRLRGVVLLVGSRHAAGAAFEEFYLEALGEEGSRELLESTAGAALPDQAVAWIHARAAGNPLFTLEYMRQLSRAGHLWSDGRRWNWRSPPADVRPPRVGAVIEYLVAGARAAGADCAAALDARAILPSGPVEAQLWAEVAGLEHAELDDASALLTRQGVLRGGRFTHALVRDVARGTMAAERRRELARRALHALADEPLAAAQFAEEAELPDSEALALYLSAASLAGGTVERARLQSAASRRAQGSERSLLAYEAGSVLLEVDMVEGRDLLAIAASGGAAPHVSAYAHALASAGNLGAALEVVAGFLASGADPAAASSLRLTVYNLAGAHAEALAVWRRDLAHGSNPSPASLRAAAASALATGAVELADELLARGAALPGLGTQLRCDFLSLKSLAAYHRGDAQEAVRIIGEAITELRSAGSWRALSSARLNEAAFLRTSGRFSEMNEALEECLALRRQSHDGRSYAFAQAALAELRTEQGRFDEADELLTEALDTLELYGASRFLANSLAMASSLHGARGDDVTALSFGERALRVAREVGSPRVEREILFYPAMAHARLGNGERAVALADEMDALREAAGSAPADECRGAWVRGIAYAALGRAEEAGERLREARNIAIRSGMELEAHKVALDLAALEGDPAAAAAAYRWFEEHGLTPDRARRLAAASAGGERTIATPALEPTLQLSVMGAMRLGPPGSEELVRGERRQHLLALLLQARVTGEGQLPDLTLVDALYPDLQETEGLSALRQLVHQVRRRYGQQVVSRTSNGYSLGASVSSDAETLLAAAATLAEQQFGWDAARPGSLDAVLMSLGGPPLEGLPEGAAPELARSLLMGARAVAVGAGPHYPAEASRVARWLQESEPYEAELVALEVSARLHAGDETGAAAALERARERFLEVGDELPATVEDLMGSSERRESAPARHPSADA